ncbi:MAG: tetratricopeptide repeat protein [Verrucomicrobia bacterium]|nr:tetratricopeptide repeat protein [Verrucomicrobiota bacterium]
MALSATYARVSRAGFIWDDESHLTQNPVIIGPLGFAEIWTTVRAVYYPLVLTTFWLLHKCVGLNPLPYHLVNVAWHGAAALLLWRVLRQLQVRGAWLGAVLWALHPVMVQSVAWITEMKNTQSGFFYLLCISFFLTARSSKRRTAFYLLALVSFLAAITSKPSTVMLPAVLALCLWWKDSKLRPRDLLVLTPFVLVSMCASGWTIWEQKFHSGAIGPEWAQTPLQRLLASADAICFYAWKLIWPHPLIFIYPRWTIDTSRFSSYLPLLLFVSVAVVLFWKRAGILRPVYFAFIYFVITLFPVLDFFDVYFFRFSFVSDHFQYLASMGPLALAGATLYSIRERLGPITSDAAAAAIVFLLASLSFHQTAKYRNLITLYQATLAQNRGCWMCEYNLGLALKAHGEADEAITHYRRAIAARPEYVEAHYNLAGALAAKGDLTDAVTEYRRAIAIKSDDADSHNNYGTALRQLGQSREAESEYRIALRLRPDYFDAHYNLGSLLLALGRDDEALEELRHAELLATRNSAVHAITGDVYMKKGQARDAAAQYSRAVELAPDDAAALASFSWLLATSTDDTLRDCRKSIALAQHANEIQPQDARVLHSLAAAFAQCGDFSKARATAHQALDIAKAQHNQALADALEDELALYELELPYRQQNR